MGGRVDDEGYDWVTFAVFAVCAVVLAGLVWYAVGLVPAEAAAVAP